MYLSSCLDYSFLLHLEVYHSKTHQLHELLDVDCKIPTAQPVRIRPPQARHNYNEKFGVVDSHLKTSPLTVKVSLMRAAYLRAHR